MQVPKAALDALLALDDRALWEKIASFAAGAGIPAGENMPSSEDMARLRQVLRTTELSSEGASQILNRYREENHG